MKWVPCDYVDEEVRLDLPPPAPNRLRVEGVTLCTFCGIGEGDWKEEEGEGKWVKKMQKCGGCQYVGYCSKACQAKDWKKGHKEVCK